MSVVRLAISTIIISCIILSSCASVIGGRKYDQHFFAVLNAQMEALKTGEYHTMDRLFDLKRNSDNPSALFVDLLDYHLGAASSETLAEFITENGKKMLPLLTSKKSGPLECISEYHAICVDSIQQRNERIDWMIDAINRGVILHAENPVGNQNIPRLLESGPVK